MDNCLNDALRIIEERRIKSESDAQKRREELRSNIPDFSKIDDSLKETGSLVFSALFNKENSISLEDIKKRNLELQKERDELLIKYGFQSDYIKVNHYCHTCSDTGYVGLEMCQCLKSEIYKLRLLNSEIGRLANKQTFDSFSFDYYDDKSSIKYNFESLKKYAEEFNKDSKDNWLLIGNTGLGKTHLSTAVGLTIINKGFNVVYKSVQGMIEDYENVKFRHESFELIDKYNEADLLIIDDLGVEMSNQFSVSCIYNVINTRINNEKPIIINTNLNQKELREIYSDRITSRLFGEFKLLLFTGKDIRRLKLSNGNK